MSRILTIPCNEAKKEIGVFNKLEVLHIPVGVSIDVSFTHTPTSEDLLPLTETIKDLNPDESYADARRCFLHFTGSSAEDVKLIASNVTEEDGFQEVTQKKVIALETSTKTALETLLDGLAKEINPYLAPPSTTMYGGAHATETTVLSKVLTCDKIDITTIVGSTMGGACYGQSVHAELDGVSICESSHYESSTYAMTDPVNNNVLENVKGKTLSIRMYSNNASAKCSYTLQEYTLKP